MADICGGSSLKSVGSVALGPVTKQCEGLVNVVAQKQSPPVCVASQEGETRVPHHCLGGHTPQGRKDYQTSLLTAFTIFC